MGLIAKVVTTGVALLAAGEGWAWWQAHKAQHAVQAGHSYSYQVEYRGQPDAPVDGPTVQVWLDGAAPGAFLVSSAGMVSGVKRLAITLIPIATGYVSGDALIAGFPSTLGRMRVVQFGEVGQPISEVNMLLNRVGM